MTAIPNVTEENLNQIDHEEIVNIKRQLQTINDTLQGGLRSANMKEYRNTYVINAQDSLDNTYPLYVHFNIIPEMVKIVSINVSFWFLNFRAYSTAASSGGGSTSGSGGGQTSSSGGGQTTSSGGASTPTSAAAGSSTPTSSSVSTPSGGGSTTPSGGGSTSGVTGSAVYTANATKAHTYTADQPTYNEVYLTTTLNPLHLVGTTTRTGYIVTHKHYMGDHSHTVSIASHQHVVTIGSHTHTVVNHTHTVANHTHSTPDHTHDITYGIFEDSTSPSVMLYVSKDNGLSYSLPTGSYSGDQENLDITSLINSAGSKMLKFESNARTRLSVQVTIKLDISAR